jgi:exopolyphosphatase/guanosine-5'-triphosphate,3'-diphosphate pyrophosphatase
MKKSIAIIEIGTNSIKFCIASKTNGIITTKDSVHVTRMGENVHQTGQISSSAMERSLKKIEELYHQARKAGVFEIVAIGTMIFRHAANADIFIQKIKSQCGVTIHVLSGNDEARLSYLAAISSMNGISGYTVVLDTGGGSTELTFGKDQDIYRSMSFDIGAVFLTDNCCVHDPVTHHDIECMVNEINKTIKIQPINRAVNYLIGSCGAITTMAAVKHQIKQYHSNLIHGTRLTRRDVQKQIQLFASKTIHQREQISGIQKGRADIVLAGACIVECVMEKLQCDQILVCDRGLRYGVINRCFAPDNDPFSYLQVQCRCEP